MISKMNSFDFGLRSLRKLEQKTKHSRKGLGISPLIVRLNVFFKKTNDDRLTLTESCDPDWVREADEATDRDWYQLDSFFPASAAV